MAGTWGQSAIELVQEIVKRITTVTEDTRGTTFLFQWQSIVLQKGNAIAFQCTSDIEQYTVMVVLLSLILVHGQVTIIFVVSVCLCSFSQPSSIRFGSN